MNDNNKCSKKKCTTCSNTVDTLSKVEVCSCCEGIEFCQRRLKDKRKDKNISDGLALNTGDFQCPDSGLGCIAYWNVDKEIIWIRQCFDGIWSDFNADKETEEWCSRFGFNHASTATEANALLIQYGADIAWGGGFDEEYD